MAFACVVIDANVTVKSIVKLAVKTPAMNIKKIVKQTNQKTVVMISKLKIKKHVAKNHVANNISCNNLDIRLKQFCPLSLW